MTYRSRTMLKAAGSLALLTALGLLTYFGVHKAGLERKRADAEARQVFRMDKDDIQQAVVEHGGERTVVVRAGLGAQHLPTWSVVEPLEAPADSATINSLLGTIERMDAERRLDGKQVDRQAYGLQPPRGKIELRDKNGQTYGLLVGKKSGFDNLLYVQRTEENQVLVVAGYLEELLLKKTFDLRRKEVLRFDQSLVRKIELRRGETRIELGKKGADWHLLHPFEDRANPQAVSRFLGTLANLRARSFPQTGTVEPSTLGLDPPQVEVEIVLGADQEQQLVWLGRPSGRLNGNQAYVQPREPRGHVAEIRGYQLRAFEIKPFDLQARAPIEFDESAVFKIKLASDTQLIVLEKREGKPPPYADGSQTQSQEEWYLVSPLAAKARTNKVSKFLLALRGLLAMRFAGDKGLVDQAAFGLDRPRRTITLHDRDGQTIGAVTLGKTVAEGTWLVGTSRPQVCLVDRERIEKLDIDAGDLEAGKAEKP